MKRLCLQVVINKKNQLFCITENKSEINTFYGTFKGKVEQGKMHINKIKDCYVTSSNHIGGCTISFGPLDVDLKDISVQEGQILPLKEIKRQIFSSKNEETAEAQNASPCNIGGYECEPAAKFS